MSASFIAIAFVVAVLLVNWRLVLLLVTACLVALMVSGLGILSAGPPATAGVSTAPVDQAGTPPVVGQPAPH